MFRAILFDLGDTLLDFEPLDMRAIFWRAARLTYDHLAATGHSMPDYQVYGRRYFRAMRWAYFWAKVSGREFNSFELLIQFHRKLALPMDDELLRDLACLWYRPLVECGSLEPDLLDSLRSMANAGLKLGLVSNTFVPGFAHDRHLTSVGLLELLPVRVYSSEVGYRKPDRRIFQAALNQLGIPAQETLFVGDLVKTDIVGAKRAGMKTALKQPWSNLRPHRLADYVIHHISDLLQLLEIPQTTPNVADSGTPLAPHTGVAKE
jgi:putative hydrolase of the HAD superfamily